MSELQKKIERSPMTPISLSRLRPGAEIQTKSVSMKKQPNGGLRLDLTVEMEDRVVIIPLSLTAEDAAHLRTEIDP